MSWSEKPRPLLRPPARAPVSRREQDKLAPVASLTDRLGNMGPYPNSRLFDQCPAHFPVRLFLQSLER
jgi:hypothetical protein